MLDLVADQRPENDFARMDYERDRKGPPEGFPKLPDIPGTRYTDAEFLRLEKEMMWDKAWLYAGHTDQVSKPGSWFLTRNSGVPIIVTRNLAGEVKAFYNTCQHRGAPLVTEDAGKRAASSAAITAGATPSTVSLRRSAISGTLSNLTCPVARWFRSVVNSWDRSSSSIVTPMRSR
ncbi:Rieske 2Fe-2S domain-containing protein [Novosphingobium panipatense]|uniref:Rieske 2Fe-2S domain-containing protein n=1 Tax=Novosphingobium panipatense TaxID=428991 RepID=UPI003613AB9A